MDYNRFKVFQTVYRTSNIRKAAELMRLSPSAVSKSIRTLETELDRKLFMGVGREIRPTDQAHAVFEKIEDILSRCDSLKSSDQPLRSRETVRIGSFEVFTTYFLGEWLKSAKSSERLIHVFELIPGALEEALVDRRIDIGLTFIPIPHPDLEHLKVMEIEMGIFTCRQSRWKNHEFPELPFVVPNTPLKSTPTKVQGLDGWEDSKFPRKLAFTVTLLESALELVRQDLAVAYLPEFIVRLQNERAKKELQLEAWSSPVIRDRKRHPVYLVKRKNTDQSSLEKELARSLRQICKTER